MREIKFKCWKDNKMMFFTPDNGAGLMSYPVMQFTGLLDKNGKEIYEGDIVEYDKDFIGKPNDEMRYRVSFSNGSFVLASLDTGYDDYRVIYLHNFGLNIIGNIYENPKLLQ